MIAVNRMRKAIGEFGAYFAFVACAAFSSMAWGQAGYVHEISGEIFIQKGSAKPVAAKAGDMFTADMVVHTGTDAKVILKYADGQVVTLGADSALQVRTYRYVPGDLRQSISTMELLRGEIRVVTGLIGATNPEGLRVVVANSILDVRNSGGADFTVVAKPNSQEGSAAIVARGEISVRPPSGLIYKVDAGQYMPWQPGRTPPPPLPIVAAPATIQAVVAGLWATVVPASAPVVVAAAARTAAIVAAASTAQVAASADPKQAGYLDTATNNVSIRTGTGKPVSAAVGRTFAAGSTINTGTEGKAVLKFADGQVVVLGPNTTISVDQYQFDPRNIKASKSSIDLVDGAMRIVTGVIHTENHQGISISAGASLVDIVNAGAADFALSVNTKQQDVGVAAVAVGEISVHTPYGPVSNIEAGQAAPWQPGQTSLPVVPLAAAPASIQSMVAGLSATVIPENTPVIVQSAALAAAAVAAANRAQAAASADPGNPRLQAAAQAAAEKANTASQTATAESQAVAATVFAATLAALPATAAGPAQAQVPAAPPIAPPAAPITPSVTPGGGVLRTCTGSPC